MSEKINVLHVVGRMDYGGTEALLMNLLRSMDTEWFQYDFVEQTPNPCAHDAEILSLGGKIFRCPHISLTNMKKYRRWWRNFLQEHPEYRIIHGHSRGSGPIYMDEAKKAGRITIAHCHSNSYGRGTRGLARRIWQLPLHNIADYNFACSEGAGISQYGKNGSFHVIKNGIQSELFRWNPLVREKVRRSFQLNDEFVLGNVARFENPKNHEFILKVFSAIHKRIPDSRLMLVGDGSKRELIHGLADKLQIEDSIIYTGVRSDVYELLQAMDVFVFPSLYEGLPLSCVEAQAAGLPTYISADVVAGEVKVTDLVEFISLNKTAQEWADIIINGQINIEERRDTSREIMEKGFDIGTTARWLEEFYSEVLSDEV